MRVRLPHSSLYWKVCGINGAVLCAGALALMLSPVSVSRRVLLSEALVLAVGLALVLVLNALLLRRALAPVDRVIAEMSTVQLGGAGQRIHASGNGSGAQLAHSYDAMLDRLENERQSSNAHALAAQEAERHRIAQELHDQVGQSLTVVLLGLKHLEARVPEDLRTDLELLRESARTGLDDVRRVARELRPGVLEDLGLQAALAALATDVSARGGPAVRRSFGRGLPALPPETEVVVYRVAQEALTNVLRHADATQVDLSLVRVGPQVVLEVRDDGCGIAATSATHTGAGLSGMRDRAALVEGQISITSTPTTGTTVRLHVPAADAEPRQ